MWIIINCGKVLNRCEYQTFLPVSWETCMQIKKQQLEPCTEQLIGSRLRKEYDRAVCCHPVCLIYTLSTSWEMLGWMRGENYQQPQICRWYHCNGRKRRGTKGLLDEGERGKWKACLTLNIQMTKAMASGFISSVQFSHSLVSDSLWPHGLQHARSPCHFMANRWRKNRNSDRLYFLGLQNHWGLWL